MFFFVSLLSQKILLNCTNTSTILLFCVLSVGGGERGRGAGSRPRHADGGARLPAAGGQECRLHPVPRQSHPAGQAGLSGDVPGLLIMR